MNEIAVTLPRAQWQSIRDAADKASPASLYSEAPGLFGSYHDVDRVISKGLEADAGSANPTIKLLPSNLASIFNLPEFNGLRDGLPSREQWFEV